MTSPRIAIIGAGICGAAILEAVTRAGIGRPTLFEKDRAAAGATGLSGGLVRIYHTDPVLADLAAQSVPALRRLDRTVPSSIGYVQAGSLYMEPGHRVAALRAEVERLKGLGDWPLRVLTPDEGRARFPEFDWVGVGAAVYEEHAGYASPGRTTEVLLNLATARGAVLAERTVVRGIHTRRGRVAGVRLATAPAADSTTADMVGADIVGADIVVVAAGAWSRDLLTGPAAALRTKRIQYNFLHVPGAPRHPAFIDDTTGVYGRPHQPGTSLVGMALDEWDVAPQPAVADPSTSAAIHAAALTRVPWLRDADVVGGVSGFDAYTSCGHARLGFDDQVAGLFLATGFSGGGFKMALGVGQRVAAALSEYVGA